MGKMILIKTDNEVKELEYPDEGLKSWKKLKEHIGNRCELIEHVQPKRLYTEIGAGIEIKNVPGSKVSMLVDEEFYFHCDKTKLNKIASWLYETDRHGYDLNREFCLYLDMRNHTGPTLSAEQINALKEELDSLAENDSDKLGIVRKAFGGGYKSFFPTSKKRKKSTPKPKKEETIHNFTQREVKDCDYENLEKQLLKKQLGGDIVYG